MKLSLSIINSKFKFKKKNIHNIYKKIIILRCNRETKHDFKFNKKTTLNK